MNVSLNDEETSLTELEIRFENRSEDRFSEVWPTLQKKLCPSMVPEVKYGRALFSAARYEMGLTKKADYSSEMFKFSRGGFAYTPPEGAPIIYVRIWKAANNQIRFWTKKELDDKPGSFTERDSLKQLYKKLTPKQRKEACIITAIRDPVSRFLSGYNEIEERKLFKQGQRFKAGSKQRFEAFVTGFIAGRFSHSRRMQLGHVFSAVGILNELNRQDSNLTSYLPTLSNLSSTWPKFMADTCPGIPNEIVKPMEKVSEHYSEKDQYGYHRAAEKVWKDNGTTARALCAIHAIDYACFEGLPDGVPLVCKDVFSSDAFWNNLDSKAN